MQMPTLDIAGHTDPGLKRANNEDSYKIFTPSATSLHADRGYLMVVADGMGGMGGGDVASQTTVDTLSRSYYGKLVSPSQVGPTAQLQSALEMANEAVRDQAKQLGVPRIGSTVAGLTLTSDGEVTIFNVGDSRVYRIRSRAIERMTQDQSVMEIQVITGLVSEEEAKKDRNNNLTSFIGQPNSLVPNYHRLIAQDGDVFLICSDGLWSLFEPGEILNFVDNVPAKKAVMRLIEVARQRGAPDNVTVIIVRIGQATHRRVLWVGLAGLAALLIAIVIAAVVVISTISASRTTPTVAAVALRLSSSTPTVTPSGTANGSAPLVLSFSATPDVLFVVSTSTPSITPTPLPTATASITTMPTVAASPIPPPTATERPTPTSTTAPTLKPTVTMPPPSSTATVMSSPTSTLPPTDTFTPIPPTPSMTLSPSATLLPPTITLRALGSIATETPPPTKTLTPIKKAPPIITLSLTRTLTQTQTPTRTITPTATMQNPAAPCTTATISTPSTTATLTATLTATSTSLGPTQNTKSTTAATPKLSVIATCTPNTPTATLTPTVTGTLPTTTPKLPVHSFQIWTRNLFFALKGAFIYE